MKTKFIFPLFIFLLFPFCKTFAQDSSSWEANAIQLITKAIEENECVGIAAGFSVDGQTQWADGKGFSDKKKKIPFETTTLTRIASITKPMTAVAIMQLYEQNKIELDIPIQKYLPDFPIKKEGAITIRQLLNHSAGIGDYHSNKERNNKKDYSTLEEAMGIFKDRDLVAEPGKDFNYSTYGYVVLGRIIEVVSEKTFEAYLQENIWDKAGMENTGIEHYEKEYPNKAQLYHKSNKGKSKQVKSTNLSDRTPGGGVYSTVIDLLKFGDAVLNNTLVQSATLALMVEDLKLKKEGNGYGFGWYLYGENPKFGNIFGHTGGQIGCSAMFMILPKEKACVIVISNTSGAMQEVSDIAVQLFKMIGQYKEEG